eukprot:763267-Pyramimonas_sp.AAC.1
MMFHGDCNEQGAFARASSRKQRHLLHFPSACKYGTGSAISTSKAFPFLVVSCIVHMTGPYIVFWRACMSLAARMSFVEHASGSSPC